jgi:NADPH:quinone reductase-like Zn-dependent oxidoreductase
MQAYVIQERFGLDQLQQVERPEPAAPGPGEATVAVRAVSLNYRDLMMVDGRYNPRQGLPLVPCSDGAGEVVAVGEGVTRVAVGDRVMPIFAQRWLGGLPTRERLRSTLGGPLDGTLQERLTVPAEAVVPVPAHLSDEEAACLPCAAVTAWSALVEVGRVKAGDTVLTLGTGGVSVFALQLGRALGARVIVTSSADDKLARARELGAWQGVNYRQDEGWGKTVAELTGGRGVDLVVEVGGAGTLAQSLQAVRPGGAVAVIGVLSGGATELSLTRVLMNKIRVEGVLVGDRDGFEAMARAIETQKLRPVVDRVFPFGEARAAFEHLASGRHFGKVVIRVGE